MWRNIRLFIGINMSIKIEMRLKNLGINLEKPNSPAANYIPYTIIDKLVFISGQLPFKSGKIPIKGILGKNVSLNEGIMMAEQCALCLISQLKSACQGDLDKVKQVVKLGGFVASSENFYEQPEVINGASNMMVNIFGEKGKHSRFAIGVSSLPKNAPVEVEGIFEISR